MDGRMVTANNCGEKKIKEEKRKEKKRKENKIKEKEISPTKCVWRHS
jgi:hypothetical protein